jgi:hypothetical protein
VLALGLTAGAILSLLLVRFRQPHVFNARQWHPAGKYARLWASLLLFAAPLALVYALYSLIGGVVDYQALTASQRFDHLGIAGEVLTASDYILRSSKLSLVLLPFAAKPLSRILDALGDVFFWFATDQPHSPGQRLLPVSSQQPTAQRFSVALEHLLASSAHVVVLAHSQGTVIAAHSLSSAVQKLRGNGVRITLVTLGSPISSLYDKFFGVPVGYEFAALCRQEPGRFAWLNACRAADYIGSRIELDGVQNFELGTQGDHSGYWSDKALLAWLQRVAQGRSFNHLLAHQGRGSSQAGALLALA